MSRLPTSALLLWVLVSCSGSATAVAPVAPAPAAQAPAAHATIEPPEGFVRVEVRGVGRDGQSAILATTEPARFLRIELGPELGDPMEARMALRTPSRPLTHDLLDRIIDGMGVEVRHAEISKPPETARDDYASYRGTVAFADEGRPVRVDGRAGDAILMAVGRHRPIYVSPEVLAAAEIDVDSPVRTGVSACDRVHAAAVSCASELTPYERALERAAIDGYLYEWRTITPPESDADKVARCLAWERGFSPQLRSLPCWRNAPPLPAPMSLPASEPANR